MRLPRRSNAHVQPHTPSPVGAVGAGQYRRRLPSVEAQCRSYPWSGIHQLRLCVAHARRSHNIRLTTVPGPLGGRLGKQRPHGRDVRVLVDHEPQDGCTTSCGAAELEPPALVCGSAWYEDSDRASVPGRARDGVGARPHQGSLPPPVPHRATRTSRGWPRMMRKHDLNWAFYRWSQGDSNP